MKIDEITRNSFLAPLYCMQDIPPFDDDGEYQLDEDDFWNIYNPAEMNIPDADRKALEFSRQDAKHSGDQFRQDVEKFLTVVPDQDTLKAAADMVSSLDGFSSIYSGIIQYSETLERIASLEQTISELEPIAKKYPGLLATIKRLKADRDKMKAKQGKPIHGQIRRCYETFLAIYHGKRRVSERVFENWCNGKHAPTNFPVDSWHDPLKLAEFAGLYDRGERAEAGRPIHGMTEEQTFRKRRK